MSDIQVPKKTRKRGPEGWVYILAHPNAPERIKVGFSESDPERLGGRIRHLTFLLRAFRLDDVKVFSCQHDNAVQIEQIIKNALKVHKLPSQAVGDSTETFEFDFDHCKKMIEKAIESYKNEEN